jgi:hypothetical protein
LLNRCVDDERSEYETHFFSIKKSQILKATITD